MYSLLGELRWPLMARSPSELSVVVGVLLYCTCNSLDQGLKTVHGGLLLWPRQPRRAMLTSLPAGSHLTPGCALAVMQGAHPARIARAIWSEDAFGEGFGLGYLRCGLRWAALVCAW